MGPETSRPAAEPLPAPALPSDGLLPEGLIRDEVIGGKDGWLFLHGGATAQFDHLSGKKVVKPAHVANMRANVRRRQAAARRIGARYLNVVMPSKPVCCRDRLPAPFDRTCRSLFERYFREPLDRDSPGLTLYPLAEMTGSENFRRLDTHPNDRGYLQAAHAILARFDIVLDRDFRLEPRPAPGDLAVMLGALDRTSPEPTLIDAAQGLSDFDNKLLLGKNRNTGHVRILFNPGHALGRTLLVCGDSFTVGMLPILAQAFETVLYVRGPVFPYSALDRFRPTHVLTASTERYIAHQIDEAGHRDPLVACRDADWFRQGTAVAQALRALLDRSDRPAVYETWKGHVWQGSLFHPLLGHGKPNPMVAPLGSGTGRYRSTGNDPFFTFRATTLPSGGPCRITVGIRVDRPCQARLYHAGADGRFSPEQSGLAPLRPGINKAVFSLPPLPPFPLLRLDPVDAAMPFEILSLEVDCGPGTAAPV
ncbi:hypothetical protein [Paracoccus sp. (in: a-proteobacteria)]|uniref:hypothetical protein n=1 Tax=Paracoccus sp. TaxID=267 RepID=UPI0035B15BA1